MADEKRQDETADSPVAGRAAKKEPRNIEESLAILRGKPGWTIVNDPKEKQSSPSSGGLTIVGTSIGAGDSSAQAPHTPAVPSIDKTSGGCIAIIGGIHAPESDSAKRERRIAGFFLRNLEWIAGKAQDGGGDGYISFDVQDDHVGTESDQPPKTDDARQMRFVQFCFSSDGFVLDLPHAILTAAEAELILRERPQFFFVNARRKSKDPNAKMVEHNPLQREYANGEERIAAEDLAFVLFDVWRLPVNVKIEIKAGRF